MKNYTVEPPNTCGLVILPNGLVYVGVVGADTGAPDYTTFEQFLTQDAAAARAKEIDPSYDVNIILGPLTLIPVNIGPPEEPAYVGDTLVLNCEYACGDCVVEYQWLNPGGLPIPGATSSSLTLSNLTEKLDGTYTCNATAQNEKGQTGSAGSSFKVTVYPAITPGAVAE